MRICICGGGGLGHTCAGVLSNRENVTVDLLTNRPDQWNHEYVVNLPDGKQLIGKLDIITDNPPKSYTTSRHRFLLFASFPCRNRVIKDKTLS